MRLLALVFAANIRLNIRLIESVEESLGGPMTEDEQRAEMTTMA